MAPWEFWNLSKGVLANFTLGQNTFLLYILDYFVQSLFTLFSFISLFYPDLQFYLI